MEYEIQPTPTRKADRVHSDVPGYAVSTWTPTIGFASGNGDVTYSTQSGRYTLLGDMCQMWFTVELTNKGTVGAPLFGVISQLGGFPFTARDVSIGTRFPIPSWSATSTNAVHIHGTVNASGVNATLGILYAASTVQNGMTYGDFTNSTFLSGQFSYLIAPR